MRTRARAFDEAALGAERDVLELRAAQQAYVAAGQGEQFWTSKVAAAIAAASRRAHHAPRPGHLARGPVGRRQRGERPPGFRADGSPGARLRPRRSEAARLGPDLRRQPRDHGRDGGIARTGRSAELQAGDASSARSAGSRPSPAAWRPPWRSSLSRSSCLDATRRKPRRNHVTRAHPRDCFSAPLTTNDIEARARRDAGRAASTPGRGGPALPALDFGSVASLCSDLGARGRHAGAARHPRAHGCECSMRRESCCGLPTRMAAS